MKVAASVPHQFSSGELLDPEKVNNNFQYVADVINDCAQQRYAHSVVTLPFYLGITGMSQADNQATRSYLIYAPVELTIERMFLDGALASGAATVVVYNASTGATAPTGVANPVFTPTTTEATLTYTQSIVIPAGSTYRIEITGTTFTTSKLDLILHFRTDRYKTSTSDTVETPTFELVVEGSNLDATVFAANSLALNTASNANIAKQTLLRVSAYVFPSFTSATDPDLLRQEVPLADSGDTVCTAYGIYCHTAYAAAGAAGNTITSTLANATGASTGLSVANSMNGVTETAAFDGTPTVSLSSVSADAPSNTALDYRLTVANSALATCNKTVVWLYTT